MPIARSLLSSLSARLPGLPRGGDAIVRLRWGLLLALIVSAMPVTAQEPAVVQLGTPADGGTEIALRPTLSWESENTADSYALELSNRNDFGAGAFVIAARPEGTQYTVTGLSLAGGTEYFWRVRGVNTDGNGEWSAIASFITINQAPAVDSELADQSGAERKPFTQDVSGHFSDADGNELTFSATGLPDGLSISDNGLISGTPTADAAAASPHTVEVTVADPWEQATSTFTFSVVDFDSLFAGGSGEEDTPWQINTAPQLALMSLALDSHYVLSSDIDLGGDDPDGLFWNEGEGWEPVGSPGDPFSGSFDGANFTIGGLFIRRATTGSQGLFGALSKSPGSSEVSNLVLEAVDIVGGGRVGALVGFASSAVIDNVRVDGHVEGLSYVGGIAGVSRNARAIHFEGSVTGVQAVGGLAGQLIGLLQDSRAHSNVTGQAGVGGLVGASLNGEVRASYATGEVVGETGAGGLVGYDAGSIRHSYATATVSADAEAGGLVGRKNSGIVVNSYATGLVSGAERSGGLTGDQGPSAAINGSFWDMDSTAQPLSAADDAEGLSTAEMQTQSNFTDAGWDFDTIWAMYPTFNNGYPYLQWALTVLPPAQPDVPANGSDDISLTPTLSWLRMNKPDYLANAYDLQLATDTNFHDLVLDEQGLKPDEFTVPDASLLLGDTAYYWRVRGVDTDGAGLWSETFLFTTLNRSPVIETAIDDQSATETQAFILNVATHFNDPEGQDLEFTATDLPDGLSINDAGLISGTPAEESVAASPHQTTVTATDPGGKTVTASFDINVAGFGTLFAGGEGSSELPWQINTATQLSLMRLRLSGHYELLQNIDLGGDDQNTAFWNDGEGWQPIGSLDGAFLGNFDGNGHSIQGLFINREEASQGLFGVVGSDSILSNLSLINVNITGLNYLGALAGNSISAVIENISVNGQMHGTDWVGGLIGRSSASVSNSTASVTVTGNQMIGGLIGQAAGGSVRNSHAEGDVSGDGIVGGLVGIASANQIIESFASGAVTGTQDIGGLVGQSFGGIQNSYALGKVTGETNVGGLVGYQISSSVADSYASGPVTGENHTGGLVGIARPSGLFYRSFWDNEATGQSESVRGDGRSTAEMQIAETFTHTNWDFDKIWAIDPDRNGGYPYLQWQQFAPKPSPPGPSTPAVSENPVINGNVSDGALNGDITINNNGVVNGGRINGQVNSTGVITGSVELAAGSSINGGSVSGNISGDSVAPALIRNADIATGARLENVVIGEGTRLDVGVELGSNVRFEDGSQIPAGLDLTPTLQRLQWVDGDGRNVANLSGTVTTSTEPSNSLIRSIQQMDDFEPAGNEINQNPDNGELVLVTDDTLSTVLPVQVSQADADAPEGVFINDNGDIVFITAERRLVVNHPSVADMNAFTQAMSDLGLEVGFDERTNLQVSEHSVNDDQTQVDYFSARPQVTSLPASGRSAEGFYESPTPALANVITYSYVFTDARGRLLEQEVVPVPANWFALRQAVLELPGFTAARIDTSGIISVEVDGAILRGRVDYSVARGAATPSAGDAVSIVETGDLNLDGTPDYLLNYPGGDTQVLYIYP